jgi:hypothetical protein
MWGPVNSAAHRLDAVYGQVVTTDLSSLGPALGA